MNLTKVVSRVGLELEPLLSEAGFVTSDNAVWSRRTGEGKHHLEIYCYKEKYMPKGVAAFSCVFSLCNLQVWPVLKSRVRFSDHPGTVGSSIFLLKDQDDGKVSDAFRERRLRRGDYGFWDEESLAESIDRFKSDVGKLVLPFFDTCPDHVALVDNRDAAKKDWGVELSRELLTCIEAMYGSSATAVRMLRGLERREGIASSVLSLLRLAPKSDPAIQQLDSLRSFVSTLGREQAAFNEVAGLESAGQFKQAESRLRELGARSAPEFANFRLAVSLYRQNNYLAAISAAHEEAKRNGLYRQLSLELAAKAHLKLGQKSEAASLATIADGEFSARQGFSTDDDAMQLGRWEI